MWWLGPWVLLKPTAAMAVQSYMHGLQEHRAALLHTPLLPLLLLLLLLDGVRAAVAAMRGYSSRQLLGVQVWQRVRQWARGVRSVTGGSRCCGSPRAAVGHGCLPNCLTAHRMIQKFRVKRTSLSLKLASFMGK